MEIWISQIMSAGLFLSDLSIKEKGREFANLFNVPSENIKYPNGWLFKFKYRNILKTHRLHGEAASVPFDIVFDERLRLRELLSQYNPK